MTGEAPSLLATVETFLDLTRMAPSTLGRAVARDPRFVSTLRAGRSPGERLAGRVRRDLVFYLRHGRWPGRAELARRPAAAADHHAGA